MGTDDRRFTLGIDFGTSGVKCALLERGSGRSFVESSPWKTEVRHPGYSELDTEQIWRSLLDCIAKALKLADARAEQIAGIGACALCPGLIAVDRDTNALTKAITFQDMRSAEYSDYINALAGPEELFSITANRLMSGSSSVTSMLWLMNSQPELWSRVYKLVHIPSWFVLKVTGGLGMDRSQACGTGLFDIHSQKWSERLTSLCGIDPELLPPVYTASTEMGTVAEPELLAMGFRRDTPVALGGGDTACAALALNATAHGGSFVSMGTSSVLTICTEQDRFDNRFINRSHVIPDRWIMTGAMSTTGGALRWFRDNFCEELLRQEAERGVSAYQLLDEQAGQVEPRSDGLLFLPYMNGERSPVFDSRAKGVFLGVGMDTTRADFARAILESVGFGIRQLLEIAKAGLPDLVQNKLVLVGGGSCSSLWCRILASVTGLPVETTSITHAGAVGAAMLGAMAAGLPAEDFSASQTVDAQYEPEHIGAYNELYARYIGIYPACRDLF